MKKYILTIFFNIILIFNSSANDEIDSYSLFYEVDGEGALFLYYIKDEIYGQIITYGGYKWFKATYTNSDKYTSTFIQPSNLGQSMNMDSWMQPRYQIDEFFYEFEQIDRDQILTFVSPEATQTIIGYMTRNESFSIASLSDDAWYAGTFVPIKNTENLDDLLNLNTKTFCMLIKDPTIENIKSNQLNKDDLLIYREPCD